MAAPSIPFPDRYDTPVFFEALAAAHPGYTAADAVRHYREVSDMTDIHRVEAFLEDHTI